MPHENPKIPQPRAPFERDVILSKHPTYNTRQRLFSFLREAFEATGQFGPWMGHYLVSSAGKSAPSDRYQMKTALFPHHREPPVDFQNRARRSKYPNFLEWLIRLYVGLLTRETPSRTEYPEEMLEYIDRVTKRGDSLNSVMARTYIPWGLVLGEYHAIVDRPRTVENAASAAEDTAEPTMQELSPERLLDWRTDDEGRFVWVKWETEVDVTHDPMVKEHKVKRQIWYFTRDGWWFFDDVPKEGETAAVYHVEDSGEWDDPIKGRVPIASYKRRQGRSEGKSAIYNAAFLMRELFNVLSLKQTLHYDITFPIFTYPGKGKDPLGDLDVGAMNVWPFDQEGKHRPDVIQADANAPEELRKEEEQIVLQLKFLAAVILEGDDVGETGIARAYAFLVTDRTLSAEAKVAEDFEREALELVADWKRIELADKLQPGYPRSFDIAETMESLEALQRLLDMQTGSPTEVLETKMAAVEKVHQDLPGETMKNIRSEIETAVQEDEGLDDQGAQLPPGAVPPGLEPPDPAVTDPRLPQNRIPEIEPR